MRQSAFFLPCVLSTALLTACKDEEEPPLPIPAAPTVAFSVVGPYSAGDTTRFTNESVSATSYKWDFGDGSTATTDAPIHIYQQPGSYVVRLDAINRGGTTSDERTITIYQSPVGSLCKCKIITYTYSTPKTRLPDKELWVESAGGHDLILDGYAYEFLGSNTSQNSYQAKPYAAPNVGYGRFTIATDSLYIMRSVGGPAVMYHTVTEYFCKRK